MFDETIGKLADLGASKAAFLQRHPAGFLVSAAMAGIYVGFGILLIFSLGSLLDPSVRPLVMGASFGLALILVVFAGSELYTGLTMTLTLSTLERRTTPDRARPRLGGELGRQPRGRAVPCGAVRGRRRRPDHQRVERARLQGRGRQDERRRLPARLPGDPLQLAGLSGALDVGAHRERSRPDHRHRLVPLRLHRLGLRAFGRQHDALRRRAPVAAPGDGDLDRRRVEPPLGHDRQHHRRGRPHGRRLLVRLLPSACRGNGRGGATRGVSAMGQEFSPEQKRWLEGFASGAAAVRSLPPRGAPPPRSRAAPTPTS